MSEARWGFLGVIFGGAGMELVRWLLGSSDRAVGGRRELRSEISELWARLDNLEKRHSAATIENLELRTRLAGMEIRLAEAVTDRDNLREQLVRLQVEIGLLRAGRV
jgi:chromosome segregation ATPase